MQHQMGLLVTSRSSSNPTGIQLESSEGPGSRKTLLLNTGTHNFACTSAAAVSLKLSLSFA